MARRKNVKRIDPRYFLHETVNRNDDGSALEEASYLPGYSLEKAPGPGVGVRDPRTGGDIPWDEVPCDKAFGRKRPDWIALKKNYAGDEGPCKEEPTAQSKYFDTSRSELEESWPEFLNQPVDPADYDPAKLPEGFRQWTPQPGVPGPKTPRNEWVTAGNYSAHEGIVMAVAGPVQGSRGKFSYWVSRGKLPGPKYTNSEFWIPKAAKLFATQEL